MSSLPKFTEAFIRQNASSQSYERGRDYYRNGSVTELQQRGNQLSAEVEGSQYEPYIVRIMFYDAGFTDLDCSCPYEYGGYCKHIVAVLLTLLHQPQRIESRTPLGETLAGLDRNQLHQLILELADDHPDLADEIERSAIRLGIPSLPYQQESKQPGSVAAPGQPARPRHTPADPAPYRKQVRTILRHAEPDYDHYDYYNEEDTFIDELNEVLDQIDPFIQAGDAANALTLLLAITEECLEEWGDLEDYYEDTATEFFDELGHTWAEAILTEELSPTERTHWHKQLEKLQKKARSMNGDGGFDIALEAVEQGWDYPPLLRVFQGEITELGAWKDKAPDFADELALIRLRILERQGRDQDYLYLAEAEGQTGLYLLKLVKLERFPEAVTYGLKYAMDSETALSLAQALREKYQLEFALQIAEHGLKGEGHRKTELARWIRDTAAGMDEQPRALSAARIAFETSFNLGDYQALQALAGVEWETMKPEMLAVLKTATTTSNKIDIYLYEGMVADAIKVVDKTGGLYGYGDLEGVVEAATHSHPDWAIRQGCKQAESIMDSGQSKYYDHAVKWLRHVKMAYYASARHKEWHAYLDTLLLKHAKKYSLVPKLKTLL